MLSDEEFNARLEEEYENLQKHEPFFGKSNKTDTQIRGIIVGENEYDGGYFELQIEFPREYPFKPPIAKMLTKVWHPQFFNERVVLAILGRDWAPQFYITQVIRDMRELMKNPDPDDPLHSSCARMYKEDINQYYTRVKEWVSDHATNFHFHNAYTEYLRYKELETKSKGGNSEGIERVSKALEKFIEKLQILGFRMAIDFRYDIWNKKLKELKTKTQPVQEIQHMMKTLNIQNIINLFMKLSNSPIGGPVGQIDHITLTRHAQKLSPQIDEKIMYEIIEELILDNKISILRHEGYETKGDYSDDIWIVNSQSIFPSKSDDPETETYLSQPCAICKRNKYTKSNPVVYCWHCDQAYHYKDLREYLKLNPECSVCHNKLKEGEYFKFYKYYEEWENKYLSLSEQLKSNAISSQQLINQIDETYDWGLSKKQKQSINLKITNLPPAEELLLSLTNSTMKNNPERLGELGWMISLNLKQAIEGMLLETQQQMRSGFVLLEQAAQRRHEEVLDELSYIRSISGEIKEINKAINDDMLSKEEYLSGLERIEVLFSNIDGELKHLVLEHQANKTIVEKIKDGVLTGTMDLGTEIMFEQSGIKKDVASYVENPSTSLLSSIVKKIKKNVPQNPKSWLKLASMILIV